MRCRYLGCQLVAWGRAAWARITPALIAAWHPQPPLLAVSGGAAAWSAQPASNRQPGCVCWGSVRAAWLQQPKNASWQPRLRMVGAPLHALPDPALRSRPETTKKQSSEQQARASVPLPALARGCPLPGTCRHASRARAALVAHSLIFTRSHQLCRHGSSSCTESCGHGRRRRHWPAAVRAHEGAGACAGSTAAVGLPGAAQ